ncbi:hypothetical protein GS8_3342 [Geobacillus stearothermophilus]|uniref:Type I restriction modification DNA specificity domain-containing protein n=1 Tax=Geobacillus stearothermophilus TaxID=1422 RepID=A0ABQ7HAS7_GEOSE|nr:hypothetical protein [Geobacillus stearothermophilus]KAF6509290.1 hypothetical protein GS8_3342 [Geobacillus stearothermophilus]
MACLRQSKMDEPLFRQGYVKRFRCIYIEQFKSIFVVKPPYDEQVQIVNYVERIYTEYENLIEAINNQIKKLHEFRESLIYEAVTGKIDVRGFRKGE